MEYVYDISSVKHDIFFTLLLAEKSSKARNHSTSVTAQYSLVHCSDSNNNNDSGFGDLIQKSILKVDASWLRQFYILMQSSLLVVLIQHYSKRELKYLYHWWQEGQDYWNCFQQPGANAWGNSSLNWSIVRIKQLWGDYASHPRKNEASQQLLNLFLDEEVVVRNGCF